MSNYKLKQPLAHYFMGETSDDNKNECRTIPSLLREIADFMDANDVSDTRSPHLVINTTFEDAEDNNHFSATLYYNEED